MAETLQNSSTESMPKNCSCFTGCFRSSNKILSKDMKAAPPPPSSSKNNKTTSLKFCWSRFCANKSSLEIKHAVSEKPHPDTKDFTYSPNLNKKIITQQKNYDKKATGINKIHLPAATHGHHNSKVHNHKKDDSEIDKHGLIEKNSKFHQSVLLVKDADRQNVKKEKKRSRPSSLGSLQVVEINNVVPTKTAKVLPHSISLPPPNRNKEATIRCENDIKNGRETQGRKLDPIVGMSIMMGTLAIMLIWGKVCAIVCTCAWLYMVPRLRTVLDSKVSNSVGLDFESVEYKKKVVLEGLLKRDRRRVVGNL